MTPTHVCIHINFYTHIQHNTLTHACTLYNSHSRKYTERGKKLGSVRKGGLGHGGVHSLDIGALTDLAEKENSPRGL